MELAQLLPQRSSLGCNILRLSFTVRLALESVGLEVRCQCNCLHSTLDYFELFLDAGRGILLPRGVEQASTQCEQTLLEESYKAYNAL